MTNAELVEQFNLCKEWNDPEQWRALAGMYAAAGYPDNAARYLRFAEQATPIQVTTDPCVVIGAGYQSERTPNG